MNAYFLCFLATLGYALWAIAEKQSVNNLSPQNVLLLACVVNLILDPIYIYILYKYQGARLVWQTAGVFWVLFSIAVASMASISLTYLLKKTDMGPTITITSAYPVLAVLIYWICGKEDLTFTKIVGMILTLSGIFLLGKGM
jgi:drug/metabolite transporter (DMT)-like permease